ncbi:MAG: YihY/virulence factor BrkB family protein, partial [Armatimonadota bacterium]
IWPGKNRRGVIRRKLVSLATMAVAGLLLMVYVFANTALASMQTWIRRQDLDINIIHDFLPDTTVPVGFLIALVAFTLLYKFMPVQNVRFRVSFVGGLFAAVIWHAISPLFSYIISNTQRHSAIYQELTNVVAFSLWAFIGAQVLIIGGHFAAAYEEVFVNGKRTVDEETPEPDER